MAIRKLIFTLLSLSLLVACSEQPKINKIIAHDYSEYYVLAKKYQLNEIEIIDTVCINATQRALKDVKQGKYTYHQFSGLGNRNKGFDEWATLFKPFNIKTKSVLTSCIGFSDQFEEYCYEIKMNELIIDKFGVCFIDSIKVEAEKLYILKHPDKVYDYFDCDRNTKQSERLKSLNKAYEDSFVYPEDYKFKSGEYFSFTSADFILLKDGSIKDLEVYTEFQDEANNKYKKLFTKQLTEFVLNQKWEAATSYGYPVHSEMYFSMFYR